MITENTDAMLSDSAPHAACKARPNHVGGLGVYGCDTIWGKGLHIKVLPNAGATTSHRKAQDIYATSPKTGIHVAGWPRFPG